MVNNNGAPASQEKDILALVEEKISSDADFQTEIESLDDTEKEQKISEKKAELIKQEYATIAEKAKKDAELANNYKIRAEKAEKKNKDGNPTPTKMELSHIDIIALTKADVAEDDIQEVLDYAEYKKISVKEALNSTVIKSLLAEKKEERATAEATATKQTRKGSTTQTGSEMLKNAKSKGEVPADKEDMDKLVEARFKEKAGK
jgi:poly-gamma-glutamate capsule biosynthesis protein CapA/YwtB (metallophosphatase superfamily)